MGTPIFVDHSRRLIAFSEMSPCRKETQGGSIINQCILNIGNLPSNTPQEFGE